MENGKWEMFFGFVMSFNVARISPGVGIKVFVY